MAGITIGTLGGENGLFTRAKQAVLEQKKAQYFEEINLEIFDEQTERFETAKEEPFIQSIKTRIETKEWVSQVLMCKEENALLEEELNAENANVLIVVTKDNYEIIIDVNNSGLTASIRDSFDKTGKKYKVEYDKNSGTGDAIESQETRQGFSVILRENTNTKAGYKFVGWCENKNGTEEIYLAGSVYTPKKDTKLYAIWKADVITISFDANAGDDTVTGTMEEKTVSPNTNVVLTQNAYVREGYSFVKWNTKSDGTGTDYADKATINISEDTTLYAQWEIKETATLYCNQDKLTEGTKIQIGVTALKSGIQKVELKIGNQVAYSEETQNATTYTKELGIDDLAKIENLSFNESYTATLTITSINNTQNEETVENIKNYTIGTASNLQKLATLVNSGTTFEGETILQIKDINLSTVCSSSKGSWEPIGGIVESVNFWFNGVYNGNEKQITNLYINSSADNFKGLFGFLGYKGTVKNVIVSGSVNSSGGSSFTAGVVARNEGEVNNCINNATITTSDQIAVGGVVGGNCNKIINCTNNGNVSRTSDSNSQGTGGICGRIPWNCYLVSNDRNVCDTITIQNCINNGNITSPGNNVGGILGLNANQTISIENNINNKASTIKGTTYVGGICGYMVSSQITSCTNEGTVEATSSIAGGIVGYGYGMDLEGCKNKGNVTSDGSADEQGTGGIVGRLEGSSGVCSCSNTGNISAPTGGLIGGIVGYCSSGSIEECFNNNANIEGAQSCSGGIVGRGDGCSISNCYNYLSSNSYDITASGQNAGGIAGIIWYRRNYRKML